MTDAEIALYAELRAAVPPDWRISMRGGQRPYRRGEPHQTMIIECRRPRYCPVDVDVRPTRGRPGEFSGSMLRRTGTDELRHAVPVELLNNPALTEGTIAIDVQQIADDLATFERG